MSNTVSSTVYLYILTGIKSEFIPRAEHESKAESGTYPSLDNGKDGRVEFERLRWRCTYLFKKNDRYSLLCLCPVGFGFCSDDNSTGM